MTLILGLINSDQAIIVSDRRLSIVSDEEHNKAAILIFRDARVAAAFTGLAKYGHLVTRRWDFVTNKWLLEALMESAKPDFFVQPTIARFAALASRDLVKVPVCKPSDRRLSLFLAGYRYDETPPRAYLWLVSNFERLSSGPSPEPTLDFMVSSCQEARPTEDDYHALFIGGRDVVPAPAVESLRALLREKRPPQALVGKAVEVIRATADLSNAQGAIGKQCTSIVLPSDPTEGPAVEYHSAAASPRSYGVSFVDLRRNEFGVLAIRNPEIEYRGPDGQSSFLAVPPVPRNSPCSCGSGKKYKRCHGRKTRHGP